MLSKKSIIQAFSAAAPHYEEHAVLQREVSKRLVERLEYIKLKPESIVDLGSGTGFITQQLLHRYPQANHFSLDIALPMLALAAKQQDKPSPYLINADAQCIPLADNSVSLIVSNLLLQWCDDVSVVLNECFRVLAPGGFILFSSLGPGTLEEVAQSWAAVDDTPHVNSFIDLHNIGDQLQKANYFDVVMDTDHIQLNYSTFNALFHDLKKIGANNKHHQRRKSLTGKTKFQQFIKHYQQQFESDCGRIPASYEVIYGQAWKPNISTCAANSAGEVNIALGHINKAVKKQS